MSEIDRQTFEAKVTSSGGDEYTVDLSEFAFGGRRTQRGARYSGRPGFAREIIVFFEMENPTQKNAKEIRVALRQLFRYLDWRARRHPDEIVASCADIKDSHGVQPRQWLAGGGMTFRRIKTTLNNMRSLSGLGPLFWSNRRPDRENCASVLDEEALSGITELASGWHQFLEGTTDE